MVTFQIRLGINHLQLPLNKPVLFTILKRLKIMKLVLLLERWLLFVMIGCFF